MSTAHLSEALRSHRLRATAPRVATLAVLEDSPHAEAEDVVAQVEKRIGTVSRQAVYDALNSLTSVGLVRRVTPTNRAARYEIEGHDNHHHLLCSSCGALVDIPCSVGYAPCLAPKDTGGAQIDVAEVLYRGLCADCAKNPTGKQPHDEHTRDNLNNTNLNPEEK